MDKNNANKQRKKKYIKVQSQEVDQEERFNEIRLYNEKYNQRLENFKNTITHQLYQLLSQIQRKVIEVEEALQNNFKYSMKKQQIEILRKVQYERHCFSLEDMEHLKGCENWFKKAEDDLNKVTKQFVQTIWALPMKVGKNLPLELSLESVKSLDQFEEQEKKRSIITQFDHFLKQQYLKKKRAEQYYRNDSLFDDFYDNISFLESQQSALKSVSFQNLLNQPSHTQNQHFFNSNFQSKDLFSEKSGRIDNPPLKNSPELKASSPKRQMKKRGRKKLSERRMQQ